MRLCLGCEKDLSDKRKDANVCSSACYARVHRDKRNEDNRRCAAKRYKTNRANIVKYLLDHPCVDCGLTDPIVMEFDHREASTKRRQIGDILGSWTWNTVLTEIAKCDVRCANCHRRKTHVELGWYTKDGDANDTDEGMD